MKTEIIPFKFLCVLLSVGLAVQGCAGFHPTRMPLQELDEYSFHAESNAVTVAAMPLGKDDVKRYFDADLAKKNIWPMRVAIQNRSKNSYLFSKGLIKPRPATALTAARKGRRGAGHRLFWGSLLIATFFGIPLGVPLVATGIQGLGANSSMETYYKQYEIPDGQIDPGQKSEGVIYFQSPNRPTEIIFDFLDAKTDERLPVTLVLGDLKAAVSEIAAAKEIVPAESLAATGMPPLPLDKGAALAGAGMQPTLDAGVSFRVGEDPNPPKDAREK